MTALKDLIQNDYLIFDNVVDMTLASTDDGISQPCKGLRHAITRQSIQTAAAQSIELQADDTEIEVFTATLGGNEPRRGYTITEGAVTYWIMLAYERTMDSRWTLVCRRNP